VRIITAAAPAVRGGRALTLRLLLPARSATLDAVAGRVAAMLAEVGVGTEVRAVGDDSFFLDHVASGEFDLALFSWPGTPFPATQNRPVYAKPVPAPDGSLTVGQNYAGVGTDEIDQLFARASRELDAPAARNITHEADARIWAAAHSLPLYQPPQVVAVRASVANVGAFGFRTPRYQDIGFTGRPGS
jgi:peptide/nickel transport system substrate-binding protein